MTEGAKTLIKWLSTNAVTTYQEPVSKSATLPYISLNYTEAPSNESSVQQLTIWTRSDSSYSEAYRYADKISQILGDQGTVVDGLYITKGSPFVQNRLDDVGTIRAVYMTLSVKNLNG